MPHENRWKGTGGGISEKPKERFMKVEVNLPVLLRDQERSGRRTDMGFGYLSLDTSARGTGGS